MKIREFYEKLKELEVFYPDKYVGFRVADRNMFLVDEPLALNYFTLNENGLFIYLANDDYGYINAYPSEFIINIERMIREEFNKRFPVRYLFDFSDIPVFICNAKDVEVDDIENDVIFDDFEIVPCLDECTQPKSETETDNTFSDLKVLVDNVAYYKIMKRQIGLMKNNSLSRIKEFLEKLSTYSEINFTEEYLDFNWQGMALSIYPSSDGYFLGDTIEMWNDETCTSLGVFNNVSEVECAIEEKIDCIINQLENLKVHCEDFCDDDESIWKKDINALNVAIDCIKEFSKGRV